MATLIKQLHSAYEQTRDNNLKTALKRRQLIYREIPRIREIDRELAQVGSEIARAITDNPAQAEAAAMQIAQFAQSLQAEREDLLENNQFSRNYLDPLYDCPQCKDKGYGDDGRRCDCFKRKLIDLAYSQSDLRAKLKAENFGTFNLAIFNDNPNPETGISARDNMKQIGEIATQFIANFDMHSGDNLLFYGHTGVGKTFMCSCIAKALIDANYSVIYQTAYRLIDTIQDHKFNDTNSDSTAYHLLFNCDLLIIDDLATEFSNAFSQTELFNIINTRLLNQKKTIISTNLNPIELGEHYGERITSRFFGHYQLIQFMGDDLRLK